MNRVVPLLALAVTLAACQESSPTKPQDVAQFAVRGSGPVQQVIGAGSVVREDIEGAPRETYGFHAQVDAAGNVSGEAEVHFPSDTVKMHLDVRCLAIQGTQAWLSGPVTRSDNPSTPVGRVFLWQVQDNGEGKGAVPDRISNFIYKRTGNYRPDVCSATPSLVTYPWDNGNVQITTTGVPLTLADLVGTWDAADVLTGNPHARLTVAPNGRFTMVWWAPGRILENVSGAMNVAEGAVRVAIDEDPDTQVVSARRSGNALYVEGGEYRMKRTGTLIGDLAGTWDASVWRYTSTSSPTTAVDLVAGGHSITATIGLDSRYVVVFVPGPADSGEVLVEGGEMLTRSVSWRPLPAPPSRAFTFTLNRGTWSFSGLDAYDFDGNPATPPEPATLDVVLLRR